MNRRLAKLKINVVLYVVVKKTVEIGKINIAFYDENVNK